MESKTDFIKKPAPTLYGIIVFKVIKGGLLLMLGFALYSLSDNNLPEEYANFLTLPWVDHILQLLRIHPASKFFTYLAEKVATLTETNLLWAATGTWFYSLFSLVEGVGLMTRISWAGWMAIGESAFFIPIEIYELTRPGRASWFLFSILVINIIIVWYLVRNRHWLFRHHLHHHSPALKEKPAG